VKVSIVTVVWNNCLEIACALDSVLVQDHKDIEYIVIDGSSSDGTTEVIKSYGAKITKFVSEPDNGLYDAMNKGVALATGDIIGVLNSDDFYCNQFVISDVVKEFENNRKIDLLFGNVDFVLRDDITRPVRTYSSFSFAPWKMRFGFMPAHPAAFIKRSAYQEVGLYKLGYKIAADFDMFVRMLVSHKFRYAKLNKTLVRMRIGGVSTSGPKSYWISSKEMLRSLDENGVYSNFLFVFLRLPIKFFQLLTSRFLCRVRS